MPGPRTYGGKSVADRRLERRARFHDAALTVFTTQSYAQASVSEICAVAGLSRRQFYEEFGSRESLLLALYDAIQDAAIKAVTETLTRSAGTVQEVFGSAIAAYIESVAGDTRRAQIAFVEVVGVSEAMEVHRRRRRVQWAATVQKWVATYSPESRTPPGGWAFAGMGFIAAINGLVHEWITTGQRVPVADLIELLTVILLALIGATPPLR